MDTHIWETANTLNLWIIFWDEVKKHTKRVNVETKMRRMKICSKTNVIQKWKKRKKRASKQIYIRSGINVWSRLKNYHGKEQTWGEVELIVVGKPGRFGIYGDARIFYINETLKWPNNSTLIFENFLSFWPKWRKLASAVGQFFNDFLTFSLNFPRKFYSLNFWTVWSRNVKCRKLFRALRIFCLQLFRVVWTFMKLLICRKLSGNFSICESVLNYLGAIQKWHRQEKANSEIGAWIIF